MENVRPELAHSSNNTHGEYKTKTTKSNGIKFNPNKED